MSYSPFLPLLTGITRRVGEASEVKVFVITLLIRIRNPVAGKEDVRLIKTLRFTFMNDLDCFRHRLAVFNQCAVGFRDITADTKHAELFAAIGNQIDDIFFRILVGAQICNFNPPLGGI